MTFVLKSLPINILFNNLKIFQSKIYVTLCVTGENEVQRIHEDSKRLRKGKVNTYAL